MWEAILAWIKPASLSQVVSNFGILMLLFMAFKGRIKSLGKDGIIFAGNGVNTGERLDTIETKFSEHRKIVENALKEIKVCVEKLSEDNVEQTRQILKTQILLHETSFERKLELYDEYKRLGGNGWMDVYIKDLITEEEEGRKNMKRRKTD